MTLIVGAVKNGEIAATTASAALLPVLKEAPQALSRQDRIALLHLLMEIDPATVTACLPPYLDLCPVSGDAAGDYLGSGGWYCYLGGDDESFLALTERALEFCPSSDVWLANRAFALHLLGRPRDQIVAAYRLALATTATAERWYQVAVEDLEKHAGLRPGKTPVPPDLIAEIASLPAAPPPDAPESR